MSPMGVQGMKVHQFARGFWDHDSTSLTLGCKRLRPFAPRLNDTVSATFDTKIEIGSSDYQKIDSSQVEGQGGGTRWNPTEEQIGILEMLYRSGMRTPDAQQIERITAQLGKYGKIEGKNVFYWFQNHKARERQKQKRNNLGLSHSPRTSPSPFTTLLLSPSGGVEEELSDVTPYKRKCKSWSFNQCLEEVNKSCRVEDQKDDEQLEHRTLELFPLHPEGRQMFRI